MMTIIPTGHNMAAQFQASQLHTPTQEAENATACILCIFVKEHFPGSASRIFLLTNTIYYHLQLGHVSIPKLVTDKGNGTHLPD